MHFLKQSIFHEKNIIFFFKNNFSNFNKWVKTALKIIVNDTDIAYELQDFRAENRLFNICVGESVGGKSPEVSRVFSK